MRIEPPVKLTKDKITFDASEIEPFLRGTPTPMKPWPNAMVTLKDGRVMFIRAAKKEEVPLILPYLKKIMDGANYEPDSLKTPRIAGIITNISEKSTPVYILSIKTAGKPAFTWMVKPKPGTLYGVATYHGNMENPGAFNAVKGLAELKCNANTPREIAEFMYGISVANCKGDDIRVCAIGGIRVDDNTWKLALINRHKG